MISTLSSISQLQNYAGAVRTIFVVNEGLFNYTLSALTPDDETIYSATGIGSGFWVRQQNAVLIVPEGDEEVIAIKGRVQVNSETNEFEFHNDTTWISTIQDLQSATTKGNTTTNPIGVATDSIHQSVMLMQIGDDSPKDDKNLVAIAYTYDIEELEGAGNNGLNVDIKGVGTQSTGIRAVRHKFVSNIDPNGFNFTNSGGAAIGAENVARMTGDVGGEGGEIDALVATYSRVSINVNDDNYIVKNAAGHLIPPPSHIPNPDNPFVRYAGIVISDMVYQNNATHTAEIVLGNTAGQQAKLPEALTGHWSVYNMSPYPSSQLSSLKLGANSTPTEVLDVVGNGKFSGSVTATTFIKSGSSSNSILLGDGNVFDLSRVHTITTTTQNGNIDTLTTDGIYLIGSSATGALPPFTAGMFEVVRNGNVFITQLAYSRGTESRLAIRNSSNSGTSWSTWAELATTNAVDLKANKAGDTYTGTHNFTGATITAQTATAGTNTTQVATTEFIQAEFSARVIVNTTTVALGSSDLNTTYPNVPKGTQVICKDIIAGGLIYTKVTEAGSSDVWVSTSCTVVV